MVDTRRRNPDPTKDDNGYGDLPGGAVGFRGIRGRDYAGGYGGGADEFAGGVVDDGHGGPRDDDGFAPTRGIAQATAPSGMSIQTIRTSVADDGSALPVRIAAAVPRVISAQMNAYERTSASD